MLLRGSDATVLKHLQIAGQATHGAGGPEVISFCNVFFFASLISGLALLLIDRRNVARKLPQLNLPERWLLVAQASSGFFIGPVGFFLALNHLNVTTQTLLFSLTVPLSALAARWLLREPLPRHFGYVLGFILLGILLAGSGQWQNNLLHKSDLIGVAWALLGVAAFAMSSVINRIAGRKGWSVGITVGLSSLAASIVFAIIALKLFGPEHFLYLRLWWVLGVIGVYAICITLGSQWSLMVAYRGLRVTSITLWASISLVVSLLEAHLWLQEPLGPQALLGGFLILSALVLPTLVSGRRAA